jgi:hypothetical protein
MPVLASFPQVIFNFIFKFTMLHVFLLASTVMGTLVRVKLLFKPRITLHPGEKVHTEMTEEMLHVLQSVFAEVCLREHCIIGRLLHWVCCIYNKHKIEIKI